MNKMLEINLLKDREIIPKGEIPETYRNSLCPYATTCEGAKNKKQFEEYCSADHKNCESYILSLEGELLIKWKI